MNKNVKKVTSADTVPCKFRGKWVECPKVDIKRSVCECCGWNPVIEAERKAARTNGRRE